ncbi:HAMP domain-containing sensor histidine kinase [Allorhizobium undicola]|uniref:HAMP domain-containing sensor histidine kinase n=1 Tax=Allorhizobium undicola TaxID=78527 RepID=UPI0004888A00|nr:HAMP domain-containing sensor histidine kinase [Allorhizobium undicola]
MVRLFLNFFVIIGLTMTAATVGGISLAQLSGRGPPEERIAEQLKTIVHRVLPSILRRDGIDAARAVLSQASGGTANWVVDVRLVAADPCGEQEIFVDAAGKCYRLEILPTTIRDGDWPRALPWVTSAIAGFLSALLLTAYLVAPFERLRRGLRALAEGCFEIRIFKGKMGRSDEVSRLMQDFDLSAARLQELHDGRERLFHDISHELRSPLSRLQAVTGILRQNPARLESALDRIDREIERLDGLVDEILTLARISASDDARETRQRLDVIDLIESIVEDAAFEGQTKAVEVRFLRAFDWIGDVDGELVYRAIENVVRNAVRYAPSNSVVEVRTSVSDGALTIEIHDEGPGVAEADLVKIFQPFCHAGENSGGGFGLGLAITREALQKHGGTVYASNRKPSGLCVTMVMPAS